jgi:hypothetical protein
MFTVQITKDELRICTQLATERWLMKFGSTDQPNYDAGKKDGRLEHELLATVRTIVAEWAVAKATNKVYSLPWYPNELHPYRKHLPDVGGNIEVRTVRTQDAVALWKKDAGKAIAACKVTDSEYFTTVEVYGWVMADDVIGKPEFEDSYIGGWRYPLTSMTAFPEPEHLNKPIW